VALPPSVVKSVLDGEAAHSGTGAGEHASKVMYGDLPSTLNGRLTPGMLSMEHVVSTPSFHGVMMQNGTPFQVPKENGGDGDRWSVQREVGDADADGGGGGGGKIAV
jgi:hypothetical protein